MSAEPQTAAQNSPESAAVETHGFEAEVSRLLQLMVHAVYSDKDIFLRELISNASDACDKLRYAALTAPELIADDGGFRVELAIDKAARRLTVTDNGIGMSHDELRDNLGTIARSGTSAFLSGLGGDEAGAVSLIGQFGVGFYSVFMVASEVEVVSRKAGEAAAWAWASDGSGSYTLRPAAREGRGTTVTLTLRAGEDEFLEAFRLRRIVKTHSDHVALPVILKGADGAADETVNAASALWTRPKAEISDETYGDFYRDVARAFDKPWATLHWKAEGTIEYNALLFVPEARPSDLFDPKREARLKLYVRRVFITDACEALLPGYLRFVRGVVDSADLPLNISREMLQQSPLTAKIKAGLIKRILGELDKRAAEIEAYDSFWGNFGAVLKEGLYEDPERRDQLLKLARFKTTKGGERPVSLADYLGRLRPNQTAIYYLSGDAASLAGSPQLEAFKARDIEVLLLGDPIDDFWTAMVTDYEGKPFQSVTRGELDLSLIPEAEGRAPEDGADAANDAELGTLIAACRQALGERVKDVRASKRLTDSPVCLVADEGDMDMHLARLLRMNQTPGLKDTARILEINPRHGLVRALAARAARPGAAAALEDAAWLLFDQARIVEGEAPEDTGAFARRLSAMLAKAVA